MYVGITNDPERRQWQHQTKQSPSFTQKYNVKKLVYLEETANILDALAREKQLKGWRREKKNKLVESINPEWLDLLHDNEERSLAFAPDDKIECHSDRSVSAAEESLRSKPNTRDDKTECHSDRSISAAEESLQIPRQARDDKTGCHSDRSVSAAEESLQIPRQARDDKTGCHSDRSVSVAEESLRSLGKLGMTVGQARDDKTDCHSDRSVSAAEESLRSQPNTRDDKRVTA